MADETALLSSEPSLDPAFADVPMPAALPVASDAPFDLSVIEAEHARWLGSEGKEGKRANLRGLDLSGMDLSGRHLMEASLRGTILKGANLSGTDLRTADLADSVLDGANLTGALLSGASLARAQLHKVNATGTDFTTANFTAAIAEGITLTAAKLNGAILRDANFRHADFTHAFLRDANMRGATLVEANLSTSDLSNADCRDVNFDRTSFAGALLQNTNFRNAKLGDVDLQAADFSNALDVATEFQTQSLQSERTKLQEEQAQIAAQRADIEAREQALADETARMQEQHGLLADMEAEQAKLALKLGGISRGFVFRFVVWLLISLLVGGFTFFVLMEVENPKMDRLVMVLGSVFFLLLLSLFSMFRSVQVARITKRFVIARAGRLASLRAPAATIPRPAPLPPLRAEPVLSSVSAATLDILPKKKSGFGFGKKK